MDCPYSTAAMSALVRVLRRSTRPALLSKPAYLRSVPGSGISPFSARSLPSQAWTPAVRRSQSARRTMSLNPEPRNAKLPVRRMSK